MHNILRRIHAPSLHIRQKRTNSPNCEHLFNWCVKENYLFRYIKAFVCDITTDTLLCEIEHYSVDIATLIFVLSALHPDNFIKALTNVYEVIAPGGLVLFRDYGLYDMAQLRFKPGHKIDDNFYMRQDGTL